MMNKILMEKVRCMLIQSKPPKSLWVEILLTACCFVNLSPLTVIDFKTPFEIWSEKPMECLKPLVVQPMFMLVKVN